MPLAAEAEGATPASNRFACAVHGAKARSSHTDTVSLWLLKIDGTADSNAPGCRRVDPLHVDRAALTDLVAPLDDRTAGPAAYLGTFYSFVAPFNGRMLTFDVTISVPLTTDVWQTLNDQFRPCGRQASIFGLDEIVWTPKCFEPAKNYRLFVPSGNTDPFTRIACRKRRCRLSWERHGWQVTVRFSKRLRRRWREALRFLNADLDKRTKLVVTNKRCVGEFCSLVRIPKS